MKALIISDTHGDDTNFIKVLEIEKPVDKIIHLGDIMKLEDYIEVMADCPCFAVRGNNDRRSTLPDESIIMMGKHRAFITHGHYYSVEYGVKDVIRHARSLDCDTVMFGHTHVPQIGLADVTIINPGSLTFPRQSGRKPSYIVADIDDEGEVKYTIKYL